MTQAPTTPAMTPTPQLQMFEVVLKHSQHQLLVVQARDAGEAAKRALRVFHTVEHAVDPYSEPWVVREAKPPYTTATFAEGYFLYLDTLEGQPTH